MWIEFGRINNLKCVDYFRVTYTKSDKTGVTTITTDPIDRLEKGALMTVVPCTLYTFRVAAYEEFHGTGRRFKMLSNEVNSTLNYTVLYCTAPYCTVLYCTVLYCTVLCTVQVNFTLDYTPKFVKKPIVWEKKASLLSNARQRQLPSREKRGIFRVNRALSTLHHCHQAVRVDVSEDDHHGADHDRALPHHPDRVGPRLHRLPHLPGQVTWPC